MKRARERIKQLKWQIAKNNTLLALFGYPD